MPPVWNETSAGRDVVSTVLVLVWAEFSFHSPLSQKQLIFVMFKGGLPRQT